MQRDISRLPPLDLLAAFESAARHLSFTRAGAERFITQSAMSRQIRALEDELGVVLFKRRHRALELTPQGRHLLATCDNVLAQLRDTVAALRAPLTREVLSLSTTPGFASLWLIPRLPAFTQSNPGIDVRLDASLEMRDLRRDGFDIAVRYGPADGTPGQRLFPESIIPVCSPALLRSSDAPLRKPADLAGHTLLQIESSMPGGISVEWQPWLHAVGVPGLRPLSVLTFSSYSEAVAAAIAGQGVVLGRRPIIDALLKSRKLVTPFRDATASSRAYFLIVEGGARRRPAVQALERWLLEQARV